MKKLYSLLIFLFLLFTISCDDEAALAAEECLQNIDCAGECGGTAEDLGTFQIGNVED